MDADGDGLCDFLEGSEDPDGDGRPNYQDPDADGDGFADRDENRAACGEPPTDSDGDGRADYLDPDVPRPRPGPVDAGLQDGSGVFETDAGRGLCADDRLRPPACLSELDEGAASLCDGLDNDCDGQVDEGCPCEVGAVQRCFLGPPGRRDVGACEDGTQRCLAAGEFGGRFGPCSGGVFPQAERCDDLDNDCNGCRDDLLDCTPEGSCPGPGDERVPEARPFSSYALVGGDFYLRNDAVDWRWEVVGSPCDRMFQGQDPQATSRSGLLSYRLIDGDERDATLELSLSGDYEVSLAVTRDDDTVFGCTFVVHARAPGLRVELCWDRTGPQAYEDHGSVTDVDLHLAREGRTSRYFSPTDCYHRTCDVSAADGLMERVHVGWGYAPSPLASCTGPGARGHFDRCASGDCACPNPRLDIDNTRNTTDYVPENINLDNPRDGDGFRVMVHHWGGEPGVAPERIPTRPLVNIYCGGELAGSYGAAPDWVVGFDEWAGTPHRDPTSGDFMTGDIWRVVDVTTHTSGGRTTCDLSPIRGDGDPAPTHHVSSGDLGY